MGAPYCVRTELRKISNCSVSRLFRKCTPSIWLDATSVRNDCNCLHSATEAAIDALLLSQGDPREPALTHLQDHRLAAGQAKRLVG